MSKLIVMTLAAIGLLVTGLLLSDSKATSLSGTVIHHATKHSLIEKVALISCAARCAPNVCSCQVLGAIYVCCDRAACRDVLRSWGYKCP